MSDENIYDIFCCVLMIVGLIVIGINCIINDNKNDEKEINNCCTCCNECIKDGDIK